MIARVMPDAPHEVMLVLDANTGQNAVSQVKAFDDALGLTGLTITKLDGTAKRRNHRRHRALQADPGALHRRGRGHRRSAPVRCQGVRRRAVRLNAGRGAACLSPSPIATSGSSCDRFQSRPQALPGRLRGAARRLAHHRARRAGAGHRPLRRRQEHAAQADGRNRAAERGHRDRQRPEHADAQDGRGAVPAAPVRHRVPGSQAAVRPQRVRQRAAAAADRRLRPA